MRKSIAAATLLAILFGSTTTVDAGTWVRFLRCQGLHMGQGYHAHAGYRHAYGQPVTMPSFHVGYPGAVIGQPSPSYQPEPTHVSEPMPEQVETAPVPEYSAPKYPVPLPGEGESVRLPRSAWAPANAWSSRRRATPQYPVELYPSFR